MPTPPDKLALIDNLLDALASERPGTLAEQQDYNETIAALTRLRRTLGSDKLRRASSQDTNPFKGLMPGDAGARVLESEKKVLATKEIYARLYSAGYEFESGNPLQGLHAALKKRVAIDGDIFPVNSTMWGHRSRFSDEEIAELQRKHAGTGGKSRLEHGFQTSVGMIAAKERGARFGPEPKFPRDEAEKMIRGGATITEVAQKYGVTNQALYRHFNRREVRRLHDEGRREREQAALHERDADEGRSFH